MATSGGDHQPGLSGHLAACPELARPGAPGELDTLRLLARRLQRAVLPLGTAALPGGALTAAAAVEIAARCRPALGEALGAGDWYDALPVPGGDLLFVVGDIAGHGIDAVADMALARNALRGLAATGAGPADLLSALNQTACLFTEGVTGTVICGRYSPGRRELRWARAGHLPPVLVRDGIATVQPMPDGMLLGVYPEAGYTESRLLLRRGDTLLFFTDGLIERRAASITDTLAEFAAATVPVGPDLDRHVARILAGAASDTGDDACLLAARFR